MVSKYIGETEKNLARIFAAAETSNAILFFDEADALFGKRTRGPRRPRPLRQHRDQLPAAADGGVRRRWSILATNLRQNIDEAFMRRLHFMVDFPLPGEADRRRIWEQIWPAAAPRPTTSTSTFLAARFEVAGGNIRNIALPSAFLAAADGGIVGMHHVVAAVRREYRKIGKVLTGTEFGGHR